MWWQGSYTLTISVGISYICGRSEAKISEPSHGLANRPEFVGMIKCSSRTNIFWHIWNFLLFRKKKKKVKYVFVLHQALSHDGEMETVKIEINFIMMILWQLLQKFHIISLCVSLLFSPVTPSWCVFVSLTFHD